MRFAAVCLVVFACSGAFAAPTHTTAPLVKGELVPSALPWHWPKPVQYVTVTNLPGVQPVSGTVNIGNLPLDAGGAVRVTSAPAKQMVWYELIDAPISSPADPSSVIEVTLPQVISTEGYSSIGLFVRDSDMGSPLKFGQVYVQGAVRWTSDEPFTAAADLSHGVTQYLQAFANQTPSPHFRFASPGGDVQFTVTLRTDTDGVRATIRSLRVYLFP